MNLVSSTSSCLCPEPEDLLFSRIVDFGRHFAQVGCVSILRVSENRTNLGCKHACVREGVPFAYDRGGNVCVESVDGDCELGLLVAPTLVFALQTEFYRDLASIDAFGAELQFPVVSLL